MKNGLLTGCCIVISIAASGRESSPVSYSAALISIAALFLLAAGCILCTWIFRLRSAIRSERILSYFATSLYGQNTVEDVFWDLAENCMSRLHFEDCVIYQYEEQRKVLVQKAAFGPKNPQKRFILNPIEIPLGAGIVGSVAATGKPELIRDTTKDPRYIVDDCRRLSELTVPIFIGGKIFGVIDSEHSRKGFFRNRHLRLLQKMALICSVKISNYLMEEKLRSKIARDLHDEIGSTLTSINILSTLALEGAVKCGAVHDSLQKIRTYSARTMESMSDIVWAINPDNDTLEKVLLRMRECAAELLEPPGIRYCFDVEENRVQQKLSLHQRRDLYLIFKEALHNSVKYSHATEVCIGVQERNGTLQLRVSDNGRGFATEKSYTGNGLKNMESRCREIGARLNIHSLPQKGTTVQVDLEDTGG